VAYLSQLNNDKQRVIFILDETGLAKSAFQNSEHTKYNIFEDMTLSDAKAIVKETSSYGLLHISKLDTVKFVPKHIAFYSQESPSLSVISNLENVLESKLTDIKLQKEGVDIEKIKTSKVTVNIGQESFDGRKTSKTDSVVKLIFGGAAGYLLFMFIIIY